MDPYRNRIVRLHRGGTEVGYVLVTVEPFSITTVAHFWRRRWGPTHDILWPWIVVDGKFSDSVLAQDATDGGLSDYDQGRFMHDGESLRVEWLGPEASDSIRKREFGREQPLRT